MSDSNGSAWLKDWEALQRQYWTAWSGLMGVGEGPDGERQGAAGDQPWAEAAEAWWRQAGEFGGLGENLTEQGRWFLDMSEDVLRQFTEFSRQTDGEVATAWRMAVDQWLEQVKGGQQYGWWTQPLRQYQSLLSRVLGMGSQHLDALLEHQDDQAALVEKLRSWLSVPAFGYSRESQEDLQRLALAVLEHQEALAEYKQAMLDVAVGTTERMHARIDAMASDGVEIESLRELFNLWVDEAENAYADVVFTGDFRRVYGRLINTMMAVRSGSQKILERSARLAGWPTRSELDSAHVRIHALRSELRELRARLENDATGKEAK